MAKEYGVCAHCQGILEKTTFQQAWAKRGIEVDPKKVMNAGQDCFQCEKCDSIYFKETVIATEVRVKDSDQSVGDYGRTDGRRA